MTKNSDEFIKGLLQKYEYDLIGNKLSDPELYDLLSSKIQKLKNNHTAIITLVGGVASGKTTLAKKLVKRLKSADSITTDAFAAKTREYRHKNYGNIDKKYNLKLFKEKIHKLRGLKEGESMNFPKYDERTGIAAAAGEDNFPKTVNKVDYFIIEGDFNFLDDPDLFIYLHVPDEIRTENRIDRDRKQRGWNNMQKLKEDIKVREEKQHFPFTLPYSEDADILLLVDEDEGKYTYTVYEKGES